MYIHRYANIAFIFGGIIAVKDRAEICVHPSRKSNFEFPSKNIANFKVLHSNFLSVQHR